MTEGAKQNLSVQQLATISDEALDKAYGYGRSAPGNAFGWQANLMSAAYAKKVIDAGVTDIEKISDAIHKGWNVTAKKFVQNPDQFDDTEKLRQAGKLEAKLQQRAKLMKIDYAQLDNEEQEKDRVVARALLRAIKGQQGVAEGSVNDASESTKFMIVYNKHHPNPAAHGKPVTGDGKPWIITATDRRAALDKAHEYFVRSQTVSSFRGYVDAVPVDHSVTEGVGDVVTPFKGGKKAKSITKRHKPLIWENMLGTVYASDINDPRMRKEPKYFDYRWEDARKYAGVDRCIDLRIARCPYKYQNYPRVGQFALWGIPPEKQLSKDTQDVTEAIKGWKHALSDMMKHRAESGKDVHLVSLKKDGAESKMHDAKKSFRSEGEAREYHERVKKLNPNRNIAHNLYVGGKVEKLS